MTVPTIPVRNETSRVPTIIGVTLSFLFVSLGARALFVNRLFSDMLGFTSVDGLVELDELDVLLDELELLDDVLDGFVLEEDEDELVSRETTLEFSFLAVALPSSSKLYSSPSMVCVVFRNR